MVLFYGIVVSPLHERCSLWASVRICKFSIPKNSIMSL